MKFSGYHKLSGVDIKKNKVLFILDGITFISERTVDREGSYMGFPEETDEVCTNTFEECLVKVRANHGDLNGVEMFDDTTKLEVLTVGTEFFGAPDALVEFYPQNMSINQGKEMKKNAIKRKSYKTGHNRQR